jgi:biotin carboxyl carrier protein
MGDRATFPKEYDMKVTFWLEGEEFRLNLFRKDKNEFLVSLGEQKHRVFLEVLNAREILLNIEGRVHSVFLNSNLTSHSISVNGQSFKLEKKAVLQSLGVRERVQQRKDVKTYMPGKIIEVLAKEGDSVEEGQAVLILEAMKMQNEIKSPQSGRIARIFPESGESVETGALLFSVE